MLREVERNRRGEGEGALFLDLGDDGAGEVRGRGLAAHVSSADLALAAVEQEGVKAGSGESNAEGGSEIREGGRT